LQEELDKERGTTGGGNNQGGDNTDNQGGNSPYATASVGDMIN